jgi:hypothetical protein
MQTGEQLRNEGIARVLSGRGAWRKAIEPHIERFLMSRIGDFMAEDLRAHLASEGLEPPHPNAMGGVIFGLARKGYISRTGEYRKPTDPKSHVSMKPVWRVEAIL